MTTLEYLLKPLCTDPKVLAEQKALQDLPHRVRMWRRRLDLLAINDVRTYDGLCVTRTDTYRYSAWVCGAPDKQVPIPRIVARGRTSLLRRQIEVAYALSNYLSGGAA